MTTHYPWLWLLVAIYIIKEGFMGIMGAITIKYRNRKLDGAKWYGKVCTAISYVVLFVLLLFPSMPALLANVLIFVCAADMVFTLVMYLPEFKRMWTSPH